jgi:hypothetical protein
MRNTINSYEAAVTLRDSGDIWELVGVIFEMVMSFVAANFLKEGELKAPSKINLVFLYQAGRLVISVIRAIILYTKNYTKFKTVYLELPINDILKRL